jgi:hypothetical protein
LLGFRDTDQQLRWLAGSAASGTLAVLRGHPIAFVQKAPPNGNHAYPVHILSS